MSVTDLSPSAPRAIALLFLGLASCTKPPTVVGPQACGEGEHGVVSPRGNAVACYPTPVATYMACAREVAAATTSQDPSTSTARARGLWFCEELARAQARPAAPPPPAPMMPTPAPMPLPTTPAPTVSTPSESPPPRDDYGF